MDKAINAKAPQQTNKTPFITQINQDWPFNNPWSGCAFAASNFNAEWVSSTDFEKLALAPLKAASKRQAEFVAGRYCAKHALNQIITNPVVPARNPDTGQPDWPQGLCGSISHSHGWAAAVVSRQQDWLALGMDIERCIANTRAERLHKAVLRQSELDLFESVNLWSFAEFLTCIFSAKESLFKTLNPLTQRYFGFLDAEVISLNGDGTFKIRLLKELSRHWPNQSVINGQWARFAHGFITIAGVQAAEPLHSN